MSIRGARAGELGSLQDIERAGGLQFVDIGMPEIADDEPLPIEELERYRDADRLWVATGDDDRVIGYIVVAIVDDNAHIEQVSVDPGRARRGVGRALVEHVAEWAAALGFDAVTLTTFSDVPWNGPYYERLGFRILPASQAGPELAEIRADEAARGLDRWPRVCMRRAV